ncbi:Zinc finger CCCH domain-containing protein 43 [Hirschfeldia incana]|nr:Zinc finger CCCH domain-containing protein 43 [Hirschfeldia incana]
MIGASGSISDGLETEPVSGSPSDLNQAADVLSNEFQNVGLDDGKMMSVSEGGNDDSSKALEKEEEEEDGVSEEEDESEVLYPVRPGAEDCAFYMRTGSCKFGSTCKFNHPLPNPRKIQIAKDSKVREKEEDADKMRLMDCKYYFRTGGCKYGLTCRFNHTKPNSDVPSAPELNFLGLPIRPGEIECLFYMRNGSCKFGADCKFNHPDPTTLGGGTDSPSFHGNNGGSIGSFSPKNTFQPVSTSWSTSSPRHSNGTAPFIPSMLSQSRGASSQTTPEWNGYQATTTMYPSERSVFSTSTMNNNTSSAETSIFTPYRYQKPAEEFPERPDQPECSYYLKTGDCKFKFTCKYHHPKNRLPKQPPYALNDKGLPLRPDQVICTHYSRYGICKFGPACRFDHSIQVPDSTGSSHAVGEPPQVGANGNESDGWN